MYLRRADFLTEAELAGRWGCDSEEEATGNDRTEVWRLEVLECRLIHCRRDSGNYETTVPIPQVFYELLVRFCGLFTDD